MATDQALATILSCATPFQLPLNTAFRGVTTREGLLIGGPSGWGEFAPFFEYDDLTCARWLAAAIEAAFGQWPAPVRDSVPTNAIVPAVGVQAATELTLRAYERDGCATVKVKVAQAGQNLDDDLARVEAVRSTLRSVGATEAHIRVDANAAWTVEQAVISLTELDAVAGGLQYAEQPCATLDDLAEVRRRTSVPIAADESIRTADDPIVAAASGAADIVIVKVPPLGGVAAGLAVAQAAGVPVVVSSAMDSSVGLAAGVAMAAALPDLPYACGLGTSALLADDVVRPSLVPHAGVLPVGRPGVDAGSVARAADRVSPERAAWWRDRLGRAWRAGAGELVGDLVRGSSA
ncbi:MAG: o-succinylbenzoate synthase [Candidatus Nanopelagicales bacterium]